MLPILFISLHHLQNWAKNNTKDMFLLLKTKQSLIVGLTKFDFNISSYGKEKMYSDRC